MQSLHSLPTGWIYNTLHSDDDVDDDNDDDHQNDQTLLNTFLTER